MNLKSFTKNTLMVIGAITVFGQVKSCVNNPDKYYFKTKKTIQDLGKTIDKALSSTSTKPTIDFHTASANYNKGLQMAKNAVKHII